MEFWNKIAIDRSFEILQKLRMRIDFVLIGGWAVYFLTNAIKSKDMDIIVDFDNLSKLKLEMGIQKNDFLKRYEREIEGVLIDIYVPFYSKFAVPVEEVLQNTIRIENFKLPKPEILLILKQQAELQRKDSVKGQKDRVDIICLAKSGQIEWRYYKQLIRKFALQEYKRRLEMIVKSSRIEFEYLGITNYRVVKKIRGKILEELSAA